MTVHVSKNFLRPMAGPFVDHLGHSLLQEVVSHTRRLQLFFKGSNRRMQLLHHLCHFLDVRAARLLLCSCFLLPDAGAKADETGETGESLIAAL